MDQEMSRFASARAARASRAESWRRAAPAAHHVVALVQLREQARDVGRGRSGDRRPRSRPRRRARGRSPPRTPRSARSCGAGAARARAGRASRCRAARCQRAVARPVVHQEDLVGPAQAARALRVSSRCRSAHVLDLVVERDHDGQVQAACRVVCEGTARCDVTARVTPYGDEVPPSSRISSQRDHQRSTAREPAAGPSSTRSARRRVSSTTSATAQSRSRQRHQRHQRVHGQGARRSSCSSRPTARVAPQVRQASR